MLISILWLPIDNIPANTDCSMARNVRWNKFHLNLIKMFYNAAMYSHPVNHVVGVFNHFLLDCLTYVESNAADLVASAGFQMMFCNEHC